MQPQTTETFGRASDENSATVAPSRWDWSRIRTITYWIFTVILCFELAAGSVWGLLQIEWVRVQLNHLGYPLYYSYISGIWELGGAAVVIAPRLPRLKEWAYAGCFFQFSGAVASHLLAGDSVEAWRPALVYAGVVIVSWALRPAHRRLPNVALARETRPLAWAVPIGILLLLYVVAYLTLPYFNATMHERARDFGWIAR